MNRSPCETRSKAMNHLRNAGKRALDVAVALGRALVAEAIKAALNDRRVAGAVGILAGPGNPAVKVAWSGASHHWQTARRKRVHALSARA